MASVLERMRRLGSLWALLLGHGEPRSDTEPNAHSRDDLTDDPPTDDILPYDPTIPPYCELIP